MKTFSTSGTGNQQTLSEIETDKIPVYDSKADAEADLANLADGQIGATSDTGSELSAPTDTVQSGNMHAVTSNAVAESLSYSTTEQKTGGKWLDEKPIYRKTFYSATNWANYTIIGNIPNIDAIVSIRDITGQSDNKYIQNFGMDNDGTHASYSNVDVSNGNVSVIRLGVFANNLPSSVTIEYTKTTD
jgi:hypothetical protein